MVWLKGTIKFLIIVIFLGLAVWGGYYGYKYIYEWFQMKSITTFEQCQAAGYQILTTVPSTCITPVGRKMTQSAFENYIKKKLIDPKIPCRNFCGDQVGQEVVCTELGCPCAETKQTCPDDCN